jgi:subtilisin family serine protease
MDQMNARMILKCVAIGVIAATGIAEAQRPTRTIEPQRGAAAQERAAGRYIVTLAEGVDPAEMAASHGVPADRVYRSVIKGFAGPMSEAAVARMRSDPRVIRVEPDAVMTAQQTATQSWALDRIDQRSLPLNNTTTKRYTGRGVTAYIVDSGIRFDHVEFGGRAVAGYDAFGGTGADCNGHGTHVAGMVGSANWGVAPSTTLVSVRVLDCSGSGLSSGVIAGLDWIAANRRLPAVVNMSLGGPVVQALDDAVARVTNSGALVLAAAGNEGVDACNSSPARVASALTVGSAGKTDARSSFSNYGACVDLFAPGELVPGPYIGTNTELVLMSGTSTATPLVAGAAAALLEHYPSLSPRGVHDSIRTYSTKGIVSSSLSANNHLLYALEVASGTTTSSPPPPTTTTNVNPVASFAASCTNLGCQFTDRSTDSDGRIASWAWAFGNGATSTAQNPSYTYPAAGTYTVTLRVTDDRGGTSTASGTITATAPPAASITLSARVTRYGNTLYVDLSWANATTSTVDIYRNNVKIINTANDRAHRDVLKVSGSGSFVYKVCNAGSSTCSGNLTVRY